MFFVVINIGLLSKPTRAPEAHVNGEIYDTTY